LGVLIMGIYNTTVHKVMAVTKAAIGSPTAPFINYAGIYKGGAFGTGQLVHPDMFTPDLGAGPSNIEIDVLPSATTITINSILYRAYVLDMYGFNSSMDNAPEDGDVLRYDGSVGPAVFFKQSRNTPSGFYQSMNKVVCVIYISKSSSSSFPAPPQNPAQCFLRLAGKPVGDTSTSINLLGGNAGMLKSSNWGTTVLSFNPNFLTLDLGNSTSDRVYMDATAAGKVAPAILIRNDVLSNPMSFNRAIVTFVYWNMSN